MLQLIQLLTFKLQCNLISYFFVVNRNGCGNVVCQTNSFLTPRKLKRKIFENWDIFHKYKFMRNNVVDTVMYWFLKLKRCFKTKGIQSSQAKWPNTFYVEF